MGKKKTATKYFFDSSNNLPLEDEGYREDWDEIFEKCGLNADDEEYTICSLTERYKGHATKGAWL